MHTLKIIERKKNKGKGKLKILQNFLHNRFEEEKLNWTFGATFFLSEYVLL